MLGFQPKQSAIMSANGHPYTWTQTHDQIQVAFHVPSTFKSRDLHIRYTDTILEAGLKGHPCSIKGELFEKVNHFDTLWQVEKTSLPGLSLVTIHLEKQRPDLHWPIVIRQGLKGSEGENQRDALVHSVESNEMKDYRIAETDIDHTSEYELGVLYEPANPELAMKHYLRAAAAGNVPSMLRVAAFYELGSDTSDENSPVKVPVKRDGKMAFIWHRRAADFGNPEASYIVAMALMNEVESPNIATDCEADNAFATALAYFDVSITEGGAESRYYISAAFQAGHISLRGGRGLPEAGDPIKAGEYWELSAKKGHALSYWNLGILSFTSGSNKQDGSALDQIEQGKQLFRKALEIDSTLTIPTGYETILQDVWDEAKSKAKASTTKADIAGKKKKHRRRKKKERDGSSKESMLIGISVVTAALAGVGLWWWKRR